MDSEFELERRKLAAEYRLLCEDLQRREENLIAEKAALLDHLIGLPDDYTAIYDAFKDLYHAAEAYLRIHDNGGDTAQEVVAMRHCMRWATDDAGHWAYMGERLNSEVKNESASGTLDPAPSGR